MCVFHGLDLPREFITGGFINSVANRNLTSKTAAFLTFSSSCWNFYFFSFFFSRSGCKVLVYREPLGVQHISPFLYLLLHRFIRFIYRQVHTYLYSCVCIYFLGVRLYLSIDTFVYLKFDFYFIIFLFLRNRRQEDEKYYSSRRRRRSRYILVTFIMTMNIHIYVQIIIGGYTYMRIIQLKKLEFITENGPQPN